MAPAHLSIPLIQGRGTSTETCRISSVFPPDDLWIGLDNYLNCILIYDLFLKVWLMGCDTWFICIDWMRKVWPIVAYPFRARVVLYQILPIFTLYEMFNVWTTVSTIVHLPRMFPPTDVKKTRIGLVCMDLLYIILTYHTQHWNGNVFILMKFSSLAALKVVKMTTSSAANDENFIKMTTFSFQWG